MELYFQLEKSRRIETRKYKSVSVSVKEHHFKRRHLKSNVVRFVSKTRKNLISRNPRHILK